MCPPGPDPGTDVAPKPVTEAGGDGRQSQWKLEVPDWLSDALRCDRPDGNREVKVNPAGPLEAPTPNLSVALFTFSSPPDDDVWVALTTCPLDPDHCRPSPNPHLSHQLIPLAVPLTDSKMAYILKLNLTRPSIM
ncbi:hypothetical protein DPEC_G00307250 [Dallia pectoralis]|uniref:Uncharacterized protein n=1 Tax=Dallia pectoralis TaxID=75939 RepID=A0ACC2FEM0_DALPE|nr:hypothetical protein DPEC_G00307250 [Dallia pectoralis]